MSIDIRRPEIPFAWGSVRGSVSPPVYFAHLGCKLWKSAFVTDIKTTDVEALVPGDIRDHEVSKGESSDFPREDRVYTKLWPSGAQRPKYRMKKLGLELDRRLEKEVRNWGGVNVPATRAVADVLRRSLAYLPVEIGIDGVDLWDTMRTGADYWRPGKGMSKVGLRVSHFKEDDLCPEAGLLSEFRASRCSFADFADRYARTLENHIDLAAFAVLYAMARQRLAVFYCADPYIPDFGDAAQMFSDIGYARRSWLCDRFPEIRDEGCHRVILVDFLGRFFKSAGISGRVLELDPNRAVVKLRSF